MIPSKSSVYCCQNCDADARGMNPSKSSMYRYVEEKPPKCLFQIKQPFDQSLQPAFSTNLFDRPFQPNNFNRTIPTNLLNHQNAFHSRNRRCPLSLDGSARRRVLRRGPIRHQHLRATLLPLLRWSSYLPGRHYMRVAVSVLCLKALV